MAIIDLQSYLTIFGLEDNIDDLFMKYSKQSLGSKGAMLLPVLDLINHYNPQAPDQSDRVEVILEAAAPGEVDKFFGILTVKINKAFRTGDTYAYTYPGSYPDPQSLNFY